MDIQIVLALMKIEGSRTDKILVRIHQKYIAHYGKELPLVTYRDWRGNSWSRLVEKWRKPSGIEHLRL